MDVKQTPDNAKIGKGKAGPGRPKGKGNKTTTLLKEAILRAGELAGDDYKNDHKLGDGGLVGYLRVQAKENPGPFMGLLGKVLPTQLQGDENGTGVVVLSAVPISADEWAAKYESDS